MSVYKRPQDIKVGVIGYGGEFDMGRKHLEQMQQAQMTPVAVAELDRERRAAAEEEFPGIETYSSPDEMLEKSDVNLITIITPHNTHADLGLQCLRAGRHVVCEKPLAITTSECNRMIEEARTQGVVLSTFHNRHWDGCILGAVERILQKNDIGDIVRIEAHKGVRKQPGDWWRSSKSVSGGVLYDWGVHLLEYALQLLPDTSMTEVSGYTSNGYWAPETKWKDDTVEDEAYAVVRLDSGQWLTLCISSIDSHPKEGTVEITGTEGSYIFDAKTWTTVKYENDQRVTRTGNNPKGEGWRYYQNIADHLVKDEELVITPEWSRRPIHILDLAGRSAKEKRAMPTELA